MKDRFTQISREYAPALAILAVVFLALIIYGYVRFTQEKTALIEARTEVATLENEQNKLKTQIVELEGHLALARDKNTELNEELEDERDRNNEFEEQIEDLADTVGTLDKLSKTDPELLQKYSKVYFLNEHYVPELLKKLDQQYVLNQEEEHLHARVVPYFEDLMAAAEKSDLDLRVVSAYRSSRDQTSLKSQYRVVYGSGANQFSADQGYSEHQLGTTVDFSTTELSTLDNFGGSPAFEWLKKNAHKYGFTLSYPEGNAYYQYEPWHWRFVGVDLAGDLFRKGKFFYDLDQRDINEYLVKIFD